jgi:hypothetical protein
LRKWEQAEQFFKVLEAIRPTAAFEPDGEGKLICHSSIINEA